MSTSRVHEYGLCWCRKPIEATTDPLALLVDSKYLTIESVPQGVCGSCGFKYYKADILETIEALLHGEQRERRCNAGPCW
jgi:hypothetical protein